MSRYSRRRRNSENAEAVTSMLGCLIFAFLIFAYICIGPYCLAYDINTIAALTEAKIRLVSMWEPAVFIVGMIVGGPALLVFLVLCIITSL